MSEKEETPQKKATKLATKKKTVKSGASAPAKSSRSSAKKPAPKSSAARALFSKVTLWLRNFFLSEAFKEQRAFLIGGAILLVAAISLAVLHFRAPMISPSERVLKYLDAYTRKEYISAYDNLSSKFKRNYSKEQFALLGISVRKMGMVFADPKVKTEHQIGQKAMVRYSLKIKGGPHGSDKYLQFDGTSTLSLEGGKWVITQIAGLPEDWLKDPKNLE